MIFARFSLLALCAVAAVASDAVASPTGATGEVCISRLAESIKDTPVPQDIVDFLAKVEADLPYEDHEWDELEEEVHAKYIAQYPTDSCRDYLEGLSETFHPVLEDGCMKRLEETDFGELARAKPTAEVMAVYAAVKANNVCLAWKPNQANQDESI